MVALQTEYFLEGIGSSSLRNFLSPWVAKSNGAFFFSDGQRTFLLFANVTKFDGEISNRLENARKNVE